jgi:hypothetical protein
MKTYIEILVVLFCLDDVEETICTTFFGIDNLVESGIFNDGKRYLKYLVPFDESNVETLQGNVEAIRKTLDTVNGEEIRVSRTFQDEETYFEVVCS